MYKTTILVPTYYRSCHAVERFPILRNQLDTLELKNEIDIRVLDSSRDEISHEIREAADKSGFTYIRYEAGTGMFNKVYDALKNVDTYTCLLYDDEDIISLEAVDRYVTFLHQNKDYTVCDGNVGKYFGDTAIRYNEVKTVFHITNDSPIERLGIALDIYSIDFYLWSLQTTECLKKQVHPVVEHDLGGYGDLSFELFSVAIPAALGKTKRFNEFFLARYIPIGRSKWTYYDETRVVFGNAYMEKLSFSEMCKKQKAVILGCIKEDIDLNAASEALDYFLCRYYMQKLIDTPGRYLDEYLDELFPRVRVRC